MSQRDRDQVWDRRAEQSADNWTYHPWRTAGKYLLVTLLVFGALSLLGNALGIVSLYWQAGVAKKTIGPKVTKQVYTPDNAINNIAFFHDTCRRITDADASAVRNLAARFTADREAAQYAHDPIRQQQAEDSLAQDANDLTGAESALAKDIADYNSASAQSTRNVFKGHGLPERFEPPSFPADPAKVTEALRAVTEIDCG